MPKIDLSDFQIKLQKTTLPNGLKFVHFKKPNAPIAITISSRSGARFDPKGKEGLAHFLEHMIFMGTEKYPNKKELSLVLEDSGIAYAAATGPEEVVIEFTVAKKEHLSLIADTLDQIINKPLLLEKAIELEKRVVATEISSRLSTHKRILANNIRGLIFGDSSITNNSSGNIEAVDSINRDDLLFQLKEVFPQDLTIVSCGDCEVSDLVSILAPILPYKKLNSFRITSAQNEEKFGISESMDGKLVHCKFAFPTCSIASKDKLALKILSFALGNGRSSLLKEVLRYDWGLLYSVNSGNTYFSDAGYFYIDFSLKKENLTEVLSKMTDTFVNLSNKGISLDTLNSIKNRIINSSSIAMQTVQAWVDFHLDLETIVRNNNYNYDDYLNELSDITKEEVDNVARKYLTKGNAYLWVVGNVSREKLESDLNQNA